VVLAVHIGPLEVGVLAVGCLAVRLVLAQGDTEVGVLAGGDLVKVELVGVAALFVQAMSDPAALVPGYGRGSTQCARSQRPPG
jgi:hypothetical protein